MTILSLILMQQIKSNHWLPRMHRYSPLSTKPQNGMSEKYLISR